LFISGLQAQISEPDTLYLRDGTILSGTIMNPDSEGSIRIKNEGGLTLYVAQERIDRMAVHSPRNPSGFAKESGPPLISEERIVFGARAGMALPFGDFASTLSAFPGFARTGWTAEGDVWIRVLPQLFWSTKAAYTLNAMKTDAFVEQFEFANQVFVTNGVTGRWSGWHFLTGLSSVRPLDKRFSYFFQGHIGFSRFRSPSINLFTTEPALYFLETTPGAGVTISFGAGIHILERYSVSLHFLSSNPAFAFPGSQGGLDRQPVRIIQFSAGILLSPRLKSQLSKS
jgi:hypothetical protein